VEKILFYNTEHFLQQQGGYGELEVRQWILIQRVLGLIFPVSFYARTDAFTSAEDKTVGK
jgi:hypothetical protein